MRSPDPPPLNVLRIEFRGGGVQPEVRNREIIQTEERLALLYLLMRLGKERVKDSIES